MWKSFTIKVLTTYRLFLARTLPNDGSNMISSTVWFWQQRLNEPFVFIQHSKENMKFDFSVFWPKKEAKACPNKIKQNDLFSCFCHPTTSKNWSLPLFFSPQSIDSVFYIKFNPLPCSPFKCFWRVFSAVLTVSFPRHFHRPYVVHECLLHSLDFFFRPASSYDVLLCLWGLCKQKRQ